MTYDNPPNIFATVGAIVLGWGSLGIRADAQDSNAPSSSGTLVPMAPAVDSSTDLAVKKRLEAALRSAKYSLETHVKVSVKNGTVVLSGLC